MLPATLVTLVSFVLDLSNSSPVYNMQPAFITTNIGSTNGRNIRNLPCISRRSSGLSGVCMFAIDCLKANGTHLGTCIDRFYFGSCCHIEPIKDIENSIESNIVLDSREPPERIHNTTLALGISTPSSLSSSSSTVQIVNKLSQQTKPPSSTTTENYTTTNKVTTTRTTITKLPTSTLKPNSTFRPFGEKIPSESTTVSTSTSEVSTTAQKLQTFQIIDGALLETTTKPIQSSTTVTKRTTVPAKTSTKVPVTTTKPRPAITAPSKPYQKPSKPSFPTKPSSKPTTPFSSTKPTQNSSKPVKVNSNTKRPYTTTTSRIASTKIATRKPTRRVTRPGTSATTAKPVSTTQTTVRTTTLKPTRKSPLVLTKKPTISSTTSASTTKETTTTKPLTPTSAPTSISSNLASKPAISSTSTTVSPTTISASTTTSSEKPITKKNITQIFETGNDNPATNEVIESSGFLTIGNGSTVSTSTAKPFSSTTTAGSSTSPSLSTSSPRPSISTVLPLSSPALPTSTSTTERPDLGLVTWTIDDSKNHTTVSVSNETSTIGNITEEWVPITTPDGWVLLPSVTPTTPPTTLKNETTSTSPPASSSVEPLSTFIPLITTLPETSISSESPVSTVSPDTTSSFSANTTQQQISSTTVSSEEIEKLTTVLNVTEIPVNVTSTEPIGSTTTVETTSSITSTEVVSEGKPVNMTDFTDVCGRRMWPEARIVGGEKSAFGKWPWQISLRQWRTSTYLHKCGAALLNENWAITAAHCVDNVPPSDLLLRLGEHDLSTESEPYLHEERRVQIVASHPQFDPRTFEYDLALLRFYEPVQFQPNIIPVCVPKTDENFVGRTAYVTGWGRLYEDGPLPSILQEVSVPVINNSVCESMYRSAGYIEHIPHIFICAGWRKGGFDSCEGDSGGPMVIQREDKRFMLTGVISWGIGCAEPNQPGVYTRISEFKDWINQILQF